MAATHYTHRLYFHPQNGWSAEPDGAQLRLDAQLRRRYVTEARNRLYRPNSQGRWVAVSDESKLAAAQRGLVWFGWPTMVGGRPYLAFRGVRVIDETLSSTLLNGLVVYDEDGEALAEATGAGHIFLLSTADARQFNKRVKDVGGEIHRGDPLPAVAVSAIERIESHGRNMEALSEKDALALAEAQAGDFSGRGSFERRHEQFADLMAQAQGAFDECARALRPLALPGRSIAEQSQALAVSERATGAVSFCETLCERRESAEREFARTVARAEGRLRETEPPAHRLLLFRGLGRLARENGLEVEDTSSGVRILTPHGWLRLGPGFDFEA